MKRCLAAILVLCALLSLCACGAAAPETDDGPFSLDILNTGKSDCIIVCMDGVTVVNDAADEDDFDAICAALERRGVQRIDYLVLSHYDKDHIGSAAALVRAYPVGQILGPDYEEDSMYLTLLKRAAEERNTPFLRLTENYTVETENGSFTLDPPDIDYGDDNNNSLVTTVTWRETSFLLLGDAKKNRLNEFLDVALDSYELIKLPHHGDSNKPLIKLIAQTAPRYAAATVSPAEEIEDKLLAALAAAGTEVFRTDGGTVSVEWTGKDFAVTQIK